jgi:hypothetical protein
MLMTIMITMIIFLSMGWDYVRELRPSTGLLFIQVIGEHEEPQCNDVDMGKHMIRPPERPLAILSS